MSSSSLYCCVALLSLSALLPANAEELPMGSELHGSLAPGTSHIYTATLSANQYASIALRIRSGAITLRVLGPGHNELIRLACNAKRGRERVDILSRTRSTFQLALESAAANPEPVRFDLQWSVQRESTKGDEQRLQIQSSLAQAYDLLDQDTAPSLRSGMAHLSIALTLAHEIGDSDREAQILLRLSDVKTQLGNWKEALPGTEKAASLYLELDDVAGWALATFAAGEIYSFSNPLKSLELLQSSAGAFHRLGDFAGEAGAIDSVGVVLVQMGNFIEGRSAYEQALKLARQSGDRITEMTALQNLGVLHTIVGESRLSMERFEESLRIVRQLRDRRSESIILVNVAVLNRDLGQYQQALDTFLGALQVQKELGDKREQIFTHNGLALTYFVLGDLTRALDQSEQSLVLASAVGDNTAEAFTLVAAAKFLKASQPAKAIEYLQRALAISRTMKNRRSESDILLNLSLLLEQSGRLDEAFSSAEMSVGLAAEVGDPRVEASARQTLGRILLSRGSADAASGQYRSALKLLQLTGDQLQEAQTRLGLARTHRLQGNLPGAREESEHAVRLAENLRGSLISPELRASFLAAMYAIYQFQVDLLMQMHSVQSDEGFVAQALMWSERAHARTLLEHLPELRGKVEAGLQPELAKQHSALLEQIGALTASLQGSLSKARSDQLQKLLKQALTDLDQTQGQIHKANPRYAALMEPEVLDLRALQQEILDSDTVLLEYMLGKERSWLWVVSRQSIASYALPAQEVIEEAARRLYRSLSKRPVSGNSDDWHPAAQDLSRSILPLAVDKLAAKRVVIVADGALHFVPFSVLPILTRQGTQTLLDRFEVVSLPSASVANALRAEAAGRSPALRTLEILADPVFDAADIRVKRKGTVTTVAASPAIVQPAQEPGGMLNRLPFARQEADAILALVPPGQSRAHFDFSASRTAALQSGANGGLRFLHFSTHAVLNSQNPGLSGVALSAVDELGRDRDGFLRLVDIYNMRLPVDLVVLSACRTALGKGVKGEGLVGLTRGFLYAGASRVVASLWEVDDRATSELMVRFYRGMLGPKHLSPPTALRAAQLSLAHEARWASPYFWAPFLVQGEWR